MQVALPLGVNERETLLRAEHNMNVQAAVCRRHTETLRDPYYPDIWQPPAGPDRRKAMGAKRPKRTEIDRLLVKTLDDQFLTEIQKGLNCSPFEGEAVLSVVREIF